MESISIMTLKVWIKSRAADRVLAPLRRELLELIEQDSTLLEVGCGTGDLLFQSAPKIRLGYGIDLDHEMIDFAEKKRIERNLNHLRFECIDALKIAPKQYDISTSTLCLHELGEKSAYRVLELMVNNSKKVLIADYTKAKTFSGRLGIEIDELFSGHYRNFKQYQKNGEITSYADHVGATIDRVVPSIIDGIFIWVINGKAKEYP